MESTGGVSATLSLTGSQQPRASSQPLRNILHTYLHSHVLARVLVEVFSDLLEAVLFTSISAVVVYVTKENNVYAWAPAPLVMAVLKVNRMKYVQGDAEFD